MVSTDTKRVAVTSHHPHHEVWPRYLQPSGNRRRASVNGMKAIRVHVVGKTARTANPRNEDDIFLRNTQFRKNLLHLGEDRIITTPWAPADVLIRGKIFT